MAYYGTLEVIVENLETQFGDCRDYWRAFGERAQPTGALRHSEVCGLGCHPTQRSTAMAMERLSDGSPGLDARK